MSPYFGLIREGNIDLCLERCGDGGQSIRSGYRGNSMGP